MEIRLPQTALLGYKVRLFRIIKTFDLVRIGGDSK